MSIRRRAVRARVERDKRFCRGWKKTNAQLAWLSQHIGTLIADRDGHRRLDEDGSPPLAEPFDPYFDLVQATIELNSRPSVNRPTTQETK